MQYYLMQNGYLQFMNPPMPIVPDSPIKQEEMASIYSSIEGSNRSGSSFSGEVKEEWFQLAINSINVEYLSRFFVELSWKHCDFEVQLCYLLLIVIFYLGVISLLAGYFSLELLYQLFSGIIVVFY